MHSLNHEHLAHATARQHIARSTRHEPPPGRLRLQAARRIAEVAGRLDREQARNALA